MKVKVFDVVELNNNERGTILNVNGNNYTWKSAKIIVWRSRRILVLFLFMLC